MVLTLNIADDLAARLRTHEDELPQILEFGLRELSAGSIAGFQGLAEVLETLATLPTPEEVLALRPSAALQGRIDALLEKNRGEGLSREEEREWQQVQYLEHLVRLAKGKAKGRLAAA